MQHTDSALGVVVLALVGAGRVPAQAPRPQPKYQVRTELSHFAAMRVPATPDKARTVSP